MLFSRGISGNTDASHTRGLDLMQAQVRDANVEDRHSQNAFTHGRASTLGESQTSEMNLHRKAWRGR